MRLSPALVTIIVASLSYTMALPVQAKTDRDKLNQNKNSEKVIFSSEKETFLASNFQPLKETTETSIKQDTAESSHPSCKLKIAVSTPRCSNSLVALDDKKDNEIKTLPQNAENADINTNVAIAKKQTSLISISSQISSEQALFTSFPKADTTTDIAFLKIALIEALVAQNQTPPEDTETIEDIPESEPISPEDTETLEDTPELEPISPEDTETIEDTPELEPISPEDTETLEDTPEPEPISPEDTETIETIEDTPESEPTPPGNTETPEDTPELEPTPPGNTETPEDTPESEPTPQPVPQEQTPETSQEPRVLVAEVAVVGVEDELQDIVYATIDTEPGRTTTRSQLQEDINAVYATGLFQNIEVTPEDTPLGVRLTFLVEANPVLSEVEVQTIPPESEQRVLPPEVVTEIFSDSYGEILNLRELQDGIRQINEWYSENGYELAQVVGSPQVTPDGTVTLVVAEGVIENINVRFFDEEDEPIDGKTRDFIVTREIELESGDVFKRDTAQRDLQRVFGLGIFEDVRLSFSPGENPSKVIVNVDVVEARTGSIGAGAGFSSSSGLFGQVSYQQKNLGGNNQTLGTELQIGEREFLFDVNFTDPWIAGDPYRTSYTVNAFRRRSISLVFDGDDDDIETADGEDSPRVVRTGGGINFSRPLPARPFERGEWVLSTGFQYQRVSIKNSDGDVSPESREEDGSQNLAFSDSGNDDLFIFRFGATRDRRNSRLQPTSGSLLRISTEQTAPFGSGSIFFNRVRTSYSYYVPLNLIRFSEGPQALAFNVQAGTVVGDLPPYEAFVLGGSNSVRGFAEGELGNGRSYLQATAEYRFPIFRIVGGALFFDYGTVLGTDSDVPGEPSIRRNLPGSGFGYGIGVRVQSPLGPIRVDYAINDEGDNRIHFGIGERF